MTQLYLDAECLSNKLDMNWLNFELGVSAAFGNRSPVATPQILAGRH